MTCPRCQAENLDGARFCENCGARLEVCCAACGQPVSADKGFCRSCGAALSAQRSRFGSAEAYAPTHLAEKILTSKVALEGERKQVTVLFADLKGSMELLADRDPEDARRILDPALEHMMGAVHRYEGTVNQVMGDGILALFGAPLAHEDHAARACYAALAMQDAIRREAEATLRMHGITLQIRVGLNSGEVLVRTIGNDLHMDYSAVGQTVHLAARMEQLPPPGRIWQTAETFRLVDGLVQVTSRGLVPIKGLSNPVEVFELTGVNAVRGRLQAAMARGLTRFVGRQAEMEALHQALERASIGHGQVVAVVGEPGVGKTRLFYEFVHSHRTRGWLALETTSVSYGQATRYLPVIALLRAYFSIAEGDDQRHVREKVTGRLLALDEALSPTLPAFFALMEVPVEDAEWARLDALHRHQRTLDAVKRLLLRESQVQPLILVLENLHWTDAETQALLDRLVESLPTARLLLLVNYRPEYQHGWASKTCYVQLRLDPLQPENARELLHEVLGEDPSLGTIKARLIEWTEGNPFFLEETIQALVETHALAGARGSYRLLKPVGAVRVPATVQAVLAARIDRLPFDEKRLLQTAAVIGKYVPSALLQAIAALPEAALHRGLHHLQAADFLYERSLFPDIEYTFKHALTQQVAYGSLLHAQQHALHAQILRAIENVYRERLDDKLAELAHHSYEGQQWREGVGYLERAGTRALARSANREAAACFEHALVALSHLPESRENQERAVDLRFGLRNALTPLGQAHQTLARLREAEQIAARLGDDRRRPRALSCAAKCQCILADYEGAVQASQQARHYGQSLEDFPLTIAAGMYLGRALLGLGQYRGGVEVLREVVGLLSGERASDYLGLPVLPSVFARSHLVLALAELGEFAEAERVIAKASELAERARHAETLLWAYTAAGIARLVRGQLPPAISALERAREICLAADIPVYFPLFNSPLGLAYAMNGRITEGLVLAEQAVEQTESRRQTALLAWTLLRLGEVRLLAGQLPAAAEAASRALGLFREHKEQGGEAYASRVLGELEGCLGDTARAKLLIEQAYSSAQNLGMRPLAVRCQLWLGWRRTSDEAGRDVLALRASYAQTLKELGMEAWARLTEHAQPSQE